MFQTGKRDVGLWDRIHNIYLHYFHAGAESSQLVISDFFVRDERERREGWGMGVVCLGFLCSCCCVCVVWVDDGDTLYGDVGDEVKGSSSGKGKQRSCSVKRSSHENRDCSGDGG